MWLVLGMCCLSVANSQNGEEIETGLSYNVTGVAPNFSNFSVVLNGLNILSKNNSKYEDEEPSFIHANETETDKLPIEDEVEEPLFSHVDETETENLAIEEDPMEALTFQAISQSEVIAQLEEKIKNAEKLYEDSMQEKQKCGKTVMSLEVKTRRLKYQIKSSNTYVEEISKEHADLKDCKSDSIVTFDDLKSEKEGNKYLLEKTQAQRKTNTQFVENNKVDDKLASISYMVINNARKRITHVKTINKNKYVLVEAMQGREDNLEKQRESATLTGSAAEELGDLQNVALETLQISLTKHENVIELKDELLETLQSSLGGILTLASNATAAEKMLQKELKKKNSLLVAQNAVIENRKSLLTEQPGLSEQLLLVQNSLRNQIELQGEANKINKNVSESYKNMIDDKKETVSLQSKSLEILSKNLAPFVEAGQLFSLERDEDGNLINAKSCQCIPTVPENTTISVVLNNIKDKLNIQWSKWEYHNCFAWTIRNITQDCANTDVKDVKDDAYKVRKRMKSLSSPELEFEIENFKCYPCEEKEIKLDSWTDYGDCRTTSVISGNMLKSSRQRTDITAGGLLTTVEERECKNCVLGEWGNWVSCDFNQEYKVLPDKHSSYLGMECLLRNQTILEDAIGMQCESPNEYRGFIQRLDYGRNENKKWVVKANPGNRIKFTFTKFDIEGAGDASECSGCNCDWLKIIDGSGKNLTGQTCGNDMPPPVVTLSYNATVQFGSDGYTHRSGFKVMWEEI